LTELSIYVYDKISVLQKQVFSPICLHAWLAFISNSHLCSFFLAAVTLTASSLSFSRGKSEQKPLNVTGFAVVLGRFSFSGACASSECSGGSFWTWSLWSRQDLRD
jgi:hypothetical protein